MFKLTTNYGTHYVTNSQSSLREEMWKYIKREKEAGRPYKDIIFSWGPVRVGKYRIEGR